MMLTSQNENHDPLFDDEDNKSGRIKAILKKLPCVGEWFQSGDKVAVVRMAGVIADASMMRRAGINFQKHQKAIEEAFEISNVRAVAFVINSPGGAPAQCSILSAFIQGLSKEKNIPVFTFVEDVAASGGYWLACLGDEIYAQETSIVGSIGVISAGFGFDHFIRNYGIDRRVHTSGRDKSFMDSFQPEKVEDVVRLKEIQSDMHQVFKAWVKSRRGDRLKYDEGMTMEGAFWTGRAAQTLGLIDGIGDVVTILKAKFGKKVRLVECSADKKSFLSALLPFGDARVDVGFDGLFEIAQEKTYWSRFGL